MNREQIIADHPIEAELVRRGITVTRRGHESIACCPFHDDKHPSLRIDADKRVWRCDPCDIGGSVIDLVMKLDGIAAGEAMRRLAGLATLPTNGKAAGKIVATYDYQDEAGRLLFQACRLEPKSFRQRRPDGNGGWLWNMEGVRRVLYHLPAVLRAQSVWIVEGEKDADTLATLGVVATTNVGGAGKWCDGYSDCVKGKHVVLCGDNDDPGRKHVEKVLESLAGKAKTVRVVTVPAPHKDVSDLLATIPDDGKAVDALNRLADAAAPITGPLNLPIHSIGELEREYAAYTKHCEKLSLDLGRFLPGLGRVCRPLVPGELAIVLADTGVGKTAILQNMAIHAAPLQTLLFELELPGTLCFERFVALANGIASRDVYSTYKDGGKIDYQKGAKLDHVHVCHQSRLALETIEAIIRRAELKIGEPPALVLLDYLQLLGGKGSSRYERASDIAEGLKVLAKATNTIILAASQIHRRDAEGPEISLHDGKDSGAIENSAGLVLGAWRDKTDAAVMLLRILKNTKGRPGVTFPCNFDGETFTITERSSIAGEDVPTYRPTASYP